jgi:hypothetical protein
MSTPSLGATKERTFSSPSRLNIWSAYDLQATRLRGAKPDLRRPTKSPFSTINKNPKPRSTTPASLSRNAGGRSNEKHIAATAATPFSIVCIASNRDTAPRQRGHSGQCLTQSPEWIVVHYRQRLKHISDQPRAGLFALVKAPDRRSIWPRFRTRTISTLIDRAVGFRTPLRVFDTCPFSFCCFLFQTSSDDHQFLVGQVLKVIGLPGVVGLGACHQCKPLERSSVMVKIHSKGLRTSGHR